MTWSWAKTLSNTVFILALGPAELPAQRGTEVGIHALATFADFTFAGGGFHLSLRPGGRTRFTLTASPGVVDEQFAIRGESTAQFMLNPGSLRHGFYAGGGVAGIAGEVDEAYLLLVLGWETTPGAGSGWVVETGIGGGVRILLGYRWRRLRR